MSITNKIYGTTGNDELVGTSGSDLISANDGNDVLDGGAGSDLLYGGQGDDTYHWDPVTGGRDWIGDIGGNDTLHINALASELTFSSKDFGRDLRIQFGHVSHLDIDQYFDSSPIETFVFADGTTWTREQVQAALTGPLVPAENMAPEILRMDGGRFTEGTQEIDPVVGWVRAHDENGDALTYTLLNDAGGRFRMEGHAIRVADWSLIDYETARFHEIRVLVTDASGATAEETFTLEVLDRVEEPTPPPANQNPSDLFVWAEDVPENALGGYYVGEVFGTDPDGDPLTYRIVNHDSPFTVIGTQIVLREGAVLDYETHPVHTVTIQAIDSHGGTLTRNFDIKVKDMPENPPPDNHEPQVVLTNSSVAENTSSGYYIGSFSSYDPDGDRVLVELVDSADGRFFMIENRLVVGDGSKLDYESATYHDILVRITDSRGSMVFKKFTINVTDVNETPPNQAPEIIGLSDDWAFENSPNYWAVGYIEAADPDGDNMTYELVNDADGRFAVQNNLVYVKDWTKLDYETRPIEYIKVRVTDSHNNSTEKVLAIRILDTVEEGNHPPEATLIGGHVPENSLAGTYVGTISVVDPDLDGAYIELVDNADGRFMLQGDRLLVADSSKLDYETSHAHDIWVRVTDGHGAMLLKRFTVAVDDVNEDQNPPSGNHDPAMIMLDGVQVLENSATGSFIGYLIGADPDGDPLTFNLIDNAGGRFKIENNRLVVADGTKLDYEAAQEHAIRVHVSDGRGGTREATFTIHVRDVPDTPPVDHAPVIEYLLGDEVIENAANGMIVGIVQAHDADGDPIFYELLDNSDGRFRMENNAIVVADGSRLDYEANISHMVRVRVTDSHGLSDTKTFAISVKDVAEPEDPPPPTNRPPRDLALSNTSIAENAVSGSHFARISAIDPDGDRLTYEIVGPHSGAFRLVVNDLVVDNAALLDFEKYPVQTITIRAIDTHGGFTDRTFEIQVKDVIEPEDPPPPANHAPVHLELTDYSVLENTETGTVVSLIRANDPDGDALTYSLVTPSQAFAIKGDELIVADAGALDYESGPFHTLIIRATDVHGAFVDQVVTITVEDEVDETLPGSDADDTLTGGIGNDYLSGFGGNDQIAGAAGNDTLDGGTGQDRLFGGSGNDVLIGSAGKDTLTGGAGKDIFVFDTKPGGGNIDRITDFSVRDDTIHLAKAIFKAAGPKGVLPKSAFWIGSEAHSAKDRIIYNKLNGKLSYDADGTGSKEAVQIALLKEGLALTAKDFLII